MQVKLLRVLQEMEFEQVGGNKTFHVDSRVILATNEDLSQAVADGRFRQDLYYRVNVINIELPGLRDRIADIPLLAKHFLEQIAWSRARRCTASATRRSSPCNVIAGRATYASCKTSSSGCALRETRQSGRRRPPARPGVRRANLGLPRRRPHAQASPRSSRTADHPRGAREQQLEPPPDRRDHSASTAPRSTKK